MVSREAQPWRCPQEADWARWLEQEAESAPTEGLETHLSACAACQTLVEQLTTTEDVLSWRRLLDPSLEPIEALPCAVPWGPSPHEAGYAAANGAMDGAAAAAVARVGFRLMRSLGQGATGQVYLATDPALGRCVALKLLRSDYADDPVWAARFSREARIIAGLRHEHILQVHRVERSEAGPFLVLEHIDGASLERLIKERGPLPAQEAARWCHEIAQALSHAHKEGVLHRDVKPGNILIEAKSGRALLADFGLASRLASQPRPNTEALTQSGAMLGTPAYISPEQIASADALDARADVYSLGAVLYACLTGVPPFQGTLAAVLRQAVESEPKPPRRLNPEAPPDLETICLKCLAKEPRLRYASAGELAADLERFLSGSPILARPLNRRQRTRRWLRGNRLAAGLIAALLATAMVSLGVAWLAWGWAERAREQTGRAERFQHNAQENEQAALRERDERTRLVQQQYLTAVGDLLAKQRPAEAREILDSIPESLRGWEYRWLQQLARRRNDRARIVGRHEDGTIVALLQAPEARAFITSGLDGRVLAWDGVREQPTELEQGIWSEPLRAWRRYGVPLLLETGTEPRPDCFAALAWLKPGEELVGVSCQGRIKCWSVKTNQASELLANPHPHPWHSVAVAEDGLSVLCGDDQGTIFRLRLAVAEDVAAARRPRLEQVFPGAGTALTKLACLPNGAWLAGFADGTVKLLPPALDAPLQTLALPAPIWDLAVAPRGRQVAVACGGSRVPLYDFDPRSRQLVRTDTLDRDADGAAHRVVQALQFAADGQCLLTGDERGEITLWSLPEGRVKETWISLWRSRLDPHRLRSLPWPLRRHMAGISLSADRTRAYGAGLDGILREWESQPPNQETWIKVGPRPQLRAAPDVAGVFWIGTAEGMLTFRSLVEASPSQETQAHQGAVLSLDVAAAAGLAVTAGADRQLRVWRRTPAALEPVGEPFLHSKPLKHVAISPDGAKLAWTDADDAVFLVDRLSRRILGQERLHDDQSQHPGSGRLAFSGDGQSLAVAGAFQRFRRFAAADLRLIDRLDSLVGVGQGVLQFALNPKEPLDLVTVDSLGTARFFPTPCHLEAARSAARNLVAVAFSPAGDRVVLADEVGTISFVDRRGCGFLPWQLNVAVRTERPADLGFDSSGTVLWLSYASGDVLTRALPARAEPSPPGRPWKSVKLIEGAALANMCLPERAMNLHRGKGLSFGVGLAPANRTGFAFGRESPQGFQLELIEDFARPDGKRQPVPQINRRGLALVDDPAGPALLLQLPAREPTGASVPELWMLRRKTTSSGADWAGVLIVDNDPAPQVERIRLNSGYDLAQVAHADGAQSLLHFSHRGNYLLQTLFDRNGLARTRCLGRQGDGIFLQARSGPGRLHVAWPSEYPMYMACDDATGETLDRALVTDDTTVSELKLALDARGTPSLLYFTATSDDRREVWLAERINGSWRRVRVAGGLDEAWLPSNLICGGQNDAMFLLWNTRTFRLLLLRRDESGSWRVESVDTSGLGLAPRTAFSAMLVQDASGHPIIVLAGSTAAGGSVWALRSR